jgi:hypothetical protein
MSLATKNGSLLLRNGLLGIGQSCCCAPPEPLAVTSCVGCCPSGIQEIPVRLSISISQLFQSSVTGGANSQIIYARAGGFSYDGVVLLQNIQPCGYLFFSCGDFGGLFSITLTVDFEAVAGVCVPRVTVGGSYRTCFNAGGAVGGFFNQFCNCFPAPEEQGFVGDFGMRTNEGILGLANVSGYLRNGSIYRTENGTAFNVTENRPPMVSPCQFSSSVSFSYRTGSDFPSTFRFSSNAPGITNDCKCASVSAGSDSVLIADQEEIGGFISGQASLLVETL